MKRSAVLYLHIFNIVYMARCNKSQLKTDNQNPTLVSVCHPALTHKCMRRFAKGTSTEYVITLLC